MAGRKFPDTSVLTSINQLMNTKSGKINAEDPALMADRGNYRCPDAPRKPDPPR